eukprot:scaffold8747_cov96-Cylindrotheca_fusiformis.AAC.2
MKSNWCLSVNNPTKLGELYKLSSGFCKRRSFSLFLSFLHYIILVGILVLNIPNEQSMLAFQSICFTKRIQSPIRQCHQQAFSDPFPPFSITNKINWKCRQHLEERPCHGSITALSLFRTPIDDGGVLSTEDIVVGVILALLLAFLASFLQGRGSQSDSYVLWQEEREKKCSSSSASDRTDDTNAEPFDAASNDAKDNRDSNLVFDGDSWKEMSRPENYILFKRNLGKKKKKEFGNINNGEQTGVIVALLLLFVPIFSIEFFFALSRQVFCGSGGNGLLSQSEFAQFLCSPVSSIQQ